VIFPAIRSSFLVPLHPTPLLPPLLRLFSLPFPWSLPLLSAILNLGIITNTIRPKITGNTTRASRPKSKKRYKNSAVRNDVWYGLYSGQLEASCRYRPSPWTICMGRRPLGRRAILQICRSNSVDTFPNQHTYLKSDSYRRTGSQSRLCRIGVTWTRAWNSGHQTSRSILNWRSSLHLWWCGWWW